jgi:Uma2 family endonuclease
MATTRTQIGPADHGRRMTLEEFRDAEEQSGYRYELARGVLEVTEIPGDPHAKVVDNIHEALSTYRRLHPGLILRIGHGSDIRFIIPGLELDRHPDLAVVFEEARPDDRGRLRADLAVEVVSPGSEARKRDYQDKLKDYLDYGIREYRVVDPKLLQVTVHVRREGPGGPAWEARVRSGSDVIASELLPGFAGTVVELWADADLDEGAAG